MLKTLPMTAGLILLAVVVHSGQSLGERIQCASTDGGYNYCRCNTMQGVVLVHEVGGTSCRFNESWGFDDQGIWVDRGCSGDFRVGAEAASDSAASAGKAGKPVPCNLPVIYRSRDVQGDWFVLENDIPDLHQAGFGDRAVSACIPAGWTLTVYDGIGYSGPSVRLQGPALFNDLAKDRPGDRDWSDRISSARVERAGVGGSTGLDPRVDRAARDTCESEIRQQIETARGASAVVQFSSSRITSFDTTEVGLAGDGSWSDRFGTTGFRYACRYGVNQKSVEDAEYSIKESSFSPSVAARLCEAALTERVRWEVDKKATVELEGKPRVTRLSPVDEQVEGTASITFKEEHSKVRFECLVNTSDLRVVRIDFRAE